jgi:Fic family protein
MQTPLNTWHEIDQKARQLADLRLAENLHYEKFVMYSIITHSTAIEGSTLTEQETELLFEDGLTAKSKPLVHHLMNTDLKNAYTFAAEQAKKGEPAKFSPDYLKTLNALVMKSTGGINSTMGGDFDSSLGDFRLCGVTAGVGGRSYVNYQKIPQRVDELCEKLNSGLTAALNAPNQSLRDLYEFTFSAHLDLATIHPWVDGNGRTARLLINLLQFRLALSPTKTFSEDRADYITSLKNSQETGENTPFLAFMAAQHLKTLEEGVEVALK